MIQHGHNDTTTSWHILYNHMCAQGESSPIHTCSSKK